MLLSPPNLGRGKGLMIRSRGCNQASLFIDDQGARAASSYVDAEYVNVRLRSDVVKGYCSAES